MNKIILILFALIFIGGVFAAPSLPHTFIGEVTYSGDSEMSLKNYEISASVGSYGLGVVGKIEVGNTYEVSIDPQGRTGQISFYIGGVKAEETEAYEWGGHSENFDLTINEIPSVSVCGNGMREAGEQCDALQLGTGTCENVLGIVGATGTLSCTNICTFDYSNCTAPFCGDGVCNNGESCSSCSTDCGSCSSGGGSSGNSGGSSGGSSSGGSSSGSFILNNPNNNENPIENDEGVVELSDTSKQNQEQEGKSTGAVIGAGKAKYIIPLVFVVLIVGLGVAVYLKRK